MGRTRVFDTAQALWVAADLFCRKGYEGTSVDDLVTATGIQRGSLYGAFGSKRGVFVAALEAHDGAATDLVGLDLLLVALLELAPRDDQVRLLCAARLDSLQDRTSLIGARLLARAGLEVAVTQKISLNPRSSTDRRTS